jgi:hypothetical protein|tara:strand:- start:366 stop:1358 length:993 start_codon:yes stop_codon:yes gene_type:complete
MAKEKKIKQKQEFEVNDKMYAVRRPKVEEIRKANEVRSKAFNEALQRGDMLREQLESELRKRKLWSDSREESYQALRKKVLDGEYKLKAGGIKLSRAKKVALEMADARAEMISLLSSRTDLDSNTCEGKADAARFNYLFAVCLVYDDNGEPYFENGLDDYLLNQDDAVAAAGASHFYYLLSGSDDVDNQLPENQFLQRFSFVNDDNNLVDEDGKLVNREGKHVDENGSLIRWIDDENFEGVDTEGRTVNDEGDYDVDFKPFLDDGGDPIEEPEEEDSEEEEEESPKKKAPRKKKTKTKAKSPKKEAAEAEDDEPETGEEDSEETEEDSEE